MNWPILLLLIPIAFMVWVLTVLVAQDSDRKARVGGYFNIAGWLVFFVLGILKDSGWITWPEVVIFMILFVIIFSLMVRNKKESEQIEELRNRLAEMEKAAASSNNQPI
ncbi:MAG: hypothetical protein V4726_02325 [Verrucomicrobiota bacterium]